MKNYATYVLCTSNSTHAHACFPWGKCGAKCARNMPPSVGAVSRAPTDVHVRTQACTSCDVRWGPRDGQGVALESQKCLKLGPWLKPWKCTTRYGIPPRKPSSFTQIWMCMHVGTLVSKVANAHLGPCTKGKAVGEIFGKPLVPHTPHARHAAPDTRTSTTHQPLSNATKLGGNPWRQGSQPKRVVASP